MTWCVLPSRPSIRDCIERVSSRSGFSVEQITGRSRRADLVKARHEAIYEAYRWSGMSTPVIGQAFGGRDHSSILYAIARHTEQTGKRQITNFNARESVAIRRLRNSRDYWKRKALERREVAS